MKIGTRGSALALVQAGLVRDALKAAGQEAELLVIDTHGDRRPPDTAWGEGAFVAAIERALLEGRVDIAVHSAKDVPTDVDERLEIVAYLPRADARDALVVRADAPARRLADLPAETRVGTDSPRRTGFVRAIRPDLIIHPLHGNVDTRLRRLDAGETDALVLACAGLDRLGLSERIAERLDPQLIPPAPGQGAIAVQIRADDDECFAICASIDHRPTRAAVEAERAFLMASGGGCRAPIGALAVHKGERLDLLVGYAMVDGSAVALGHGEGPASEAVELGRRLANEVHRPDRPRVLVTRAAAQAGPLLAALRAADLEPIAVPAIEIEAIRADGIHPALRAWATYRWVAATSPNGARALLLATRQAGVDPAAATWAVVGAATRSVLEAEGITAAFMPGTSTSAALGSELPLKPGDSVLLWRGDLADRALPAALQQRGAAVQDVVGYRTVEAPPASAALLLDAVALEPIDAIVFTSGSTARGLRKLADDTGVDLEGIPVVCIGSATADAASQAGFVVRVISSAPDPDAIAAATTDALCAPQLQVIS